MRQWVLMKITQNHKHFENGILDLKNFSSALLLVTSMLICVIKNGRGGEI